MVPLIGAVGVGERGRRDTGLAVEYEAATQVAAVFTVVIRKRRLVVLAAQCVLGVSGCPGIEQQVGRESGGQKALAGDRDGVAARVDADPAPPLGFSDHSRRSGPACRIEDEIARPGGHQHAAFDRLAASLDDVTLVAVGDGRGPKIVEAATRHLISVDLEMKLVSPRGFRRAGFDVGPKPPGVSERLKSG